MKTQMILLLSLGAAFAASCSKTTFDRPQDNTVFVAGAEYNAKVDILFMIDNSSSMLVYQNKLADQVPAMLNQLNQAQLDYRIGVVTTDMRTGGNGGKLIGSPSYLTSSTANLVTVMQERIRNGQTGSDLERGLESLQVALEAQKSGTGFLRADAFLVIIALTNEDDYSSASVNSFKSYFDTLKPPMRGFAKSWMMNFVGVISIDGQCSTTADFKEAGLRWMDLVSYSGGLNESICQTSLAQSVANLQVRLVEVLSEYPLDRKPVVSSIKVLINGVTIPADANNGWSYNSTKNSIVFHGTYLPKASDKIFVDFKPLESN